MTWIDTKHIPKWQDYA